jgi:hypothetical protein
MYPIPFFFFARFCYYTFTSGRVSASEEWNQPISAQSVFISYPLNPVLHPWSMDMRWSKDQRGRREEGGRRKQEGGRRYEEGGRMA